MPLHILLADAVYYFHIVFVLALIAPMFLFTGDWLKYCIIMNALVLLSWQIDKGICSLTYLEYTLRYNNSNMPDNYRFFYPILRNILSVFNRTITLKNTDKFNTMMFLLAIIIGSIRFFLFNNISLYPKTTFSLIYLIIILLPSLHVFYVRL